MKLARVVAPGLALLVAGRASAAPPSTETSRDPASAQVLFERGRAALDRGEVDAACGLLAESLRLDPAVGTLFNLAACEERQGKIASAWLHLREGIDRLPPHDTRAKPAEEQAKALQARLPHLEVRLAPDAPPGTRVTRDGVELAGPSLGLALPVNPGKHTVVATAPGRAPGEISLALAEREKKSVQVAPGAPAAEPPASPASPAPPAPAPSTAPPASPADSSGALRSIGWVTAGVGVAGLTVGTIAGILAIGSASTVDDRCDADHVCDAAGLAALDDVKREGAVATIALTAGAALVVTGVVLVIVGKPSGVSAAPRAGTGALGWTF